MSRNAKRVTYIMVRCTNDITWMTSTKAASTKARTTRSGESCRACMPRWTRGARTGESVAVAFCVRVVVCCHMARRAVCGSCMWAWMRVRVCSGKMPVEEEGLAACSGRYLGDEDVEYGRYVK